MKKLVTLQTQRSKNWNNQYAKNKNHHRTKKIPKAKDLKTQLWETTKLHFQCFSAAEAINSKNL
jgi:hypothetical protein